MPEGRRRIFQATILLTLFTAIYLYYYTRLDDNMPQQQQPLTVAEAQRVLASVPPLAKYARPTHLASLPAASSSSPRLIIIGDVHGQRAELQALLAAADYSAARGDRVVLTGDMINKGADSAGVVALAMAEGFASVRGNHEDRVLRLFALAEAVRTARGSSDAETEIQAWEEAEAAAGRLSKNDRAALATARSLTPEQRAWVADRPVILRAGAALPGSPENRVGEVLVVHAGLVPGVALEDQDPWAVMNMRTLLYPKQKQKKKKHKKSKTKTGKGKLSAEDRAIFGKAVEKKLKDQHPSAVPAEAELVAEEERLLAHYASVASSHSSSEVTDGVQSEESEGEEEQEEVVEEEDVPAPVPVDTREGRSWATVWSELQREKADDRDRTIVVYGHDAKRGLNIKDYTFGLDSGCVKGGELTALIFESDEKTEGAVRHRLVSIPCEAAEGQGADKEGKSGKKKKDKNKDDA